MKKNQEHSNKRKCVTVLKLNAGYPAQVHLGGERKRITTINSEFELSPFKCETGNSIYYKPDTCNDVYIHVHEH